MLRQSSKHFDLDRARFSILLNSSNDLDRDFSTTAFSSFNDFAEGSLTEEPDDPDCKRGKTTSALSTTLI